MESRNVWWNCSKTISYQIQRGFLLLFIFLPSRPWPSGCMSSDPILQAACLQNFLSSMKRIRPSLLGSQIRVNNLNLYLLSPSLTDSQLLLQRLGRPNTREPYSLRPMSRASHHPYGGSKA